MKGTRNYLSLLKRALPIMAFVGAGLMISCKPEPIQEPIPDEPVVVPEPEPEPEPEPNPYDGPMDSIKVLTYTCNDGGSLRYDTVMKYANDPRVTKIIYFLDSTNFNNDYRNMSGPELNNERNFMERFVNYAPTKAIGAGTYVIYPGEIYPDDSIWFINHGWKIKSSESYWGR